jgi:hypothetical protein
MTVTRNHLDADRLRLEMPISDQRAGERHGVVDRPLRLVRGVNGSRELSHRGGADVVETEVARAPEIAAGIEIAGRPRHPRECADGLARRARRRRLRA